MPPDLVQWLVAAMTAWAPPAPSTAALYEPIARDILSVALDPEEAPLFDDEDGRLRTALLVASFAAAESGGFLPAVDSGKKRGAGGTVCIMQVRVLGGATEEGWSAKELLADRTRCVRVGLHRMRASMTTCRTMRNGDRLGMYTHGKCVPDNDVARFRWGRAAAWAKKHPPPPAARAVPLPPATPSPSTP